MNRICPMCQGECVLTWAIWMGGRSGPASHLPRAASYENAKEVTGPDTGLINWANAHKVKDYEKADEIRNKCNEMGLNPAFHGDHYEMHYIK